MTDLFNIGNEDITRREAALLTLLSMMNIPEMRLDTGKRSNLMWIKRNISINNSDHPMLDTAKEITTWLIKWHSKEGK
jgi:hypothetical protein